jgi:hypothetical protein
VRNRREALRHGATEIDFSIRIVGRQACVWRRDEHELTKRSDGGELSLSIREHHRPQQGNGSRVVNCIDVDRGNVRRHIRQIQNDGRAAVIAQNRADGFRFC